MPLRLAVTGPHRVEVLEYHDHPLEADQVLIRTEMASGKHGTTQAMFDDVGFVGQEFDLDMWLFVETKPGNERPRRTAHRSRPTREKPWTTGTTGVGTVIQTGPAVRRWKLGDRVFGFMDIRETNICKEESLWELGDLDPALALCLEAAYVPFHCIRESNLRIGDSVAIIGLGALGLLGVRMAQLAGAERIFAIDPLANRRELAAAYGADTVLDPRDGDAALRLHELNNGHGVDIAIETSGVYVGLQSAIRCARMGGTVCSAGFYQGEAKGLWLGREWHHNRQTIIVPHGCGWGHQPRDYPAWDAGRANETIVSLMRQGRLTAPGLLNPIVPIHKGPDVWRLIEEDPGQVVKYAVHFM